jgi:hypothetical protein
MRRFIGLWSKLFPAPPSGSANGKRASFMVVSACSHTQISVFWPILAIRAAGNDRKHLQFSEGFDNL